ncbi:hypothetical protein ElyMa_003800700, partial [Elysia marginata]
MPAPPTSMQKAVPHQPEPRATHESPLKTKPDEWNGRLWHIYQERHTRNNPDPIFDLNKNHQKTKCWSWQWFPSEWNRQSGPRRQNCAFKNVPELITYYQSDRLMGPYLELAQLA